MKRTLLIAMLILALLNPKCLQGPSGLTHAQTGGGYDLTWSTIDAGGGTSAASPYILVGTTGQPDAGAAMTGGGYTLVGGFWGSTASQYKVYLPVVIK